MPTATRRRPPGDRLHGFQRGLQRARRLAGQHAEARDGAVVILFDRRDRRRGLGALRARLFGVERRDQPCLDAEAGDLEIVVLDAERVARIGELRLIEPRQHIIARGLRLGRDQDRRIIIARGLILRAARLDRAADLAEQPDLIGHVEPERETVARSPGNRGDRPVGQRHDTRTGYVERAAVTGRTGDGREQLRARLDQRLARLAQPRHGLCDIEIVGPRLLDDLAEQRIVELLPPGGEVLGRPGVGRRPNKHRARRAPMARPDDSPGRPCTRRSATTIVSKKAMRERNILPKWLWGRFGSIEILSQTHVVHRPASQIVANRNDYLHLRGITRRIHLAIQNHARSSLRPHPPQLRRLTRFDRPGLFGAQDILHLHRLDHRERLAGLDLVALADVERASAGRASGRAGISRDRAGSSRSCAAA